MWLPSVYCVVMVDIVWRRSRPRPIAGVERRIVPLRGHGRRPYAEARRSGTPFPATGGKDTDKTAPGARKRPARAATSHFRAGPAVPVGGLAAQDGSTSASGPAISS